MNMAFNFVVNVFKNYSSSGRYKGFIWINAYSLSYNIQEMVVRHLLFNSSAPSAAYMR